jgi:hypothetical protein
LHECGLRIGKNAAEAELAVLADRIPEPVKDIVGKKLGKKLLGELEEEWNLELPIIRELLGPDRKARMAELSIVAAKFRAIASILKRH